LVKRSLVLLLLLAPLLLKAQFEIEGQVIDADLQPLHSASVVLLNVSDSSIQTFTMSNEKGYYKLKVKDSSAYLLQFTYLGYKTVITPLDANWSKKQINHGKTLLQKLTIKLKEVNIEPTIIPMKLNGDTLIYDAEAFKTKAGDDVEALLELLPGISLDRDGNLIAQGIKVERVLVDGKVFFGDDPKLATKNLDAEAIKQIEVMDKKTEEAEYTGIDDGKVVKTINLSLKKGYKKGQFGSIEAAGGSEDSYRVKANYNLFNERTQASIVGNSNNLNETGFTFNEHTGASKPSSLISNNRQGINESYFSGINLNHEFNQKMSLNFNYIYKNSNTQLDRINNSENFSPTAVYETTETVKNNAQLNKHALNGKLRWKIDSLTALSVNARLSISKNNIQNQSTTLYSPATPDGNLVSSKLQNSDNILNNTLDINLRKKFKKKGRNWLNNYSYASKTTDLKNDLITTTFNDYLDQAQVFTESMSKQLFSSTFTEPLDEKWFINARYTLMYEKNVSGRLFFDRLAENRLFNDGLSGEFKRELSENKFKLYFIRNSEKFNLNLGAELTDIQLMVPGFNSSFQFTYPSASLLYRFQSNEQLRFNYSGRSNLPTLNQLISIPNNINPNQNYVGNLNLIPEYSQNLSLYYSKFNMETSLSYSAQITFTTINNKILNQTIINDDFTSSTSPVNTDFYQSITANARINGKLEKYNIAYNIAPNFILNNYDAFLNTLSTRVKSEAIGTVIEIGRDKKEKWDLNLGLTYNATQTEYDANPDFNRRFSNLSLYVRGELEITKSLTLYTNYRIQSFNAVSFSSGRNIHLVNLSLRQNLKNGRWMIYLNGNDILNQNIGLRRASGINSLSEESFNTRTQFFMLGVSRKLRKRPKRKENNP